MKFGGEIKMNQYVFAPKDDPYHNSQWRELYPTENLENIKKLAQAGNENKCFFVYALHPFMNSPFNFNNYNADLATVKSKNICRLLNPVCVRSPCWRMMRPDQVQQI